MIISRYPLLILCPLLAHAVCLAGEKEFFSLPSEVQEAIVQQVEHMMDNDSLWEGDLSLDSEKPFPSSAERSPNGALLYNLDLKSQPNGGWLARTEIDLVGDSHKEVVWQIIPPDTGLSNYYNDVLVYDGKGTFLFYAPPHIIYSTKEGEVSRGSISMSLPSRYGFMLIGADQWRVNEDGVVMLSYDVRDDLDERSGEFSRHGDLQIVERRYSKSGVSQKAERVAPNSARYRDLRAVFNRVREESGAPKPSGTSYVASLVHVITGPSPSWHSGDLPVETLIAQWVLAHPAQIEQAKQFSAKRLLGVLHSWQTREKQK